MTSAPAIDERRPVRTDGCAPIRDYAVIGNKRTAALVVTHLRRSNHMSATRILIPAVVVGIVVFIVLFVILPVTLWVSILAAVGAFVLYLLIAGGAGGARRTSPPHRA